MFSVNLISTSICNGTVSNQPVQTSKELRYYFVLPLYLLLLKPKLFIPILREHNEHAMMQGRM
jgi:hypothetical protein